MAVSSPSGDVHGAEECISVASALAPAAAASERLPCSSPGHADDLVLRLPGTGERRILLLGHLDTVVAARGPPAAAARAGPASSAPAPST